jgi:hypothetical protein
MKCGTTVKCSYQIAPHLAPVKVCEKKSSILRYLDLLPPSIYFHNQYTATEFQWTNSGNILGLEHTRKTIKFGRLVIAITVFNP